MIMPTENINRLIRNAVRKDLSFIDDKINGFKSIAEVVELRNHFYDFECLNTFFKELKEFLEGHEHFVPRIEGTHSYDIREEPFMGSVDHENDCSIFLGISGGGDKVYDWHHMIEVCAKNTLNLILKLGGKVVVYDSSSGWEWSYG